MNNESIRKIADHYGFAEQSRQLAEECAELIVAVNKYYRKNYTPLLSPSDYLDLQHYILNITEEIADVTIMLEQMKYLLNISNDDINKIIDMKLNRQLKRIENEK
jgi:NTP pyrophosphatase (non-canonical NTP hydrolase)